MGTVETIRDWQKKIHDYTTRQGFWDAGELRSKPEVLCLIHTEVSEAMEAYRNADAANFAEELADIVIRVLDAAEGYHIDLEAEIEKKHAHNLTRPYKHGRTVC